MDHIGVLFMSILSPVRFLKTHRERTQPEAHCIPVSKASLEHSRARAFPCWQGGCSVAPSQARLPSEPGLLTLGLYRKTYPLLAWNMDILKCSLYLGVEVALERWSGKFKASLPIQ